MHIKIRPAFAGRPADAGRTLGTREDSTVFKTVLLNRSSTSPLYRKIYLVFKNVIVTLDCNIKNKKTI